MSAPELSFVHVFRPATKPGLAPLLLLHGTGGDETDLIPLGEAVAPGAALVSPRGQVLERGAPRFFRRLAEGVFDEDDIRRRAGDLARFVADARAAYGLGAPVALGYSNGANIAAATMLLHPNALAGAVLLRPMAPFAASPDVALDGAPVLMISGAEDPIATHDSVGRLETALRNAGAAVEHVRLPASHGLTQQDLQLAARWLATRAAPATGEAPI